VSPKPKFAAIITIVGTLGFLFVVVCPLTPTPLAVSSNHGTEVSSLSFGAAQVLAPQSEHIGAREVLLADSHGVAMRVDQPPLPHPGYDRLDLTCARLC